MLTAYTPHLLGCATCMADKGSVIGQAQGFAILFMLGVLAFMFVCAGGIVLAFVRRQKKYAASVAATPA